MRCLEHQGWPGAETVNLHNPGEEPSSRLRYLTQEVTRARWTLAGQLCRQIWTLPALHSILPPGSLEVSLLTLIFYFKPVSSVPKYLTLFSERWSSMNIVEKFSLDWDPGLASFSSESLLESIHASVSPTIKCYNQVINLIGILWVLNKLTHVKCSKLGLAHGKLSLK